MKTHWGCGGIAPRILDLGTRWTTLPSALVVLLLLLLLPLSLLLLILLLLLLILFSTIIIMYITSMYSIWHDVVT